MIALKSYPKRQTCTGTADKNKRKEADMTQALQWDHIHRHDEVGVVSIS